MSNASFLFDRCVCTFFAIAEFVSKNKRLLEDLVRDKTTIEAMRMRGISPEELFPKTLDDFKRETDRVFNVAPEVLLLLGRVWAFSSLRCFVVADAV